MKKRIKAVFFDIDGTLVSFTTHAVPESARKAIQRLRERGIKVFIATGRLLRHTDVVRDIEVDGYITVNGSYCLTSSGEVIYEQAFPQQTVERIFSFVEQYGFAMELMTHENIFVEKITPEVQTAIDMVAIVPEVARCVRLQPSRRCCRCVHTLTTSWSRRFCHSCLSAWVVAGRSYLWM